jgi:CLIP-associating protein 1/2
MYPQINDPDGLINVLKVCLRTSNQHLTTATLTALPPLLPLLISRSVNYAQPTPSQPRSASSSTSSVAPSSVVDATTLRQVLTAFLPAGGVVDRLGDKEKAQAKARETLVVLGGLAYRTGGNSTMSSKSRDKGPETPILIFERFMREGGLASKVWKVKEQVRFLDLQADTRLIPSPVYPNPCAYSTRSSPISNSVIPPSSRRVP